MRVGALINGCGLVDGLGWWGDWEWRGAVGIV